MAVAQKQLVPPLLRGAALCEEEEVFKESVSMIFLR